MAKVSHEVGGRLKATEHALIQKYHDNPRGWIQIYRAVPEQVEEIHPGDWVTPVYQYADEHAGDESGWHIIEEEAQAGEIFTNGDSWLEWGYDPQ